MNKELADDLLEIAKWYSMPDEHMNTIEKAIKALEQPPLEELLGDIKAELLSFKRKNEYSSFMIDTIKIDNAVAIIESYISGKEKE